MLSLDVLESLSSIKQSLHDEECTCSDGCLIGDGLAVLLPVDQLDPAQLCVDCRAWYHAELLYKLAMSKMAN
jgi:hypothetical protein